MELEKGIPKATLPVFSVSSELAIPYISASSERLGSHARNGWALTLGTVGALTLGTVEIVCGCKMPKECALRDSRPSSRVADAQ